MRTAAHNTSSILCFWFFARLTSLPLSSSSRRKRRESAKSERKRAKEKKSANSSDYGRKYARSKAFHPLILRCIRNLGLVALLQTVLLTACSPSAEHCSLMSIRKRKSKLDLRTQEFSADLKEKRRCYFQAFRPFTLKNAKNSATLLRIKPDSFSLLRFDSFLWFRLILRK